MEKNQYVLNGKFEVLTIAKEMKMSHWVYSPIIREVCSGKVIMSLESTGWDLRKATESNGRIALHLAQYPDGRTEYCVEVNPINSSAIILGKEYPLASLESTLESIV
ncbi:hypothetical protein [Vibrio coralliilyticus]|uniref:hypothetical protein n=1 Tax=Vibrio coralliilyticus TaxID=190893 RepID=UPI00155F9B5C|nr:hypothetical protein [Vibrio coralliilyticus]NRF65351.1 hypothetical protein [Vibrio coralliilyticus]